MRSPCMREGWLTLLTLVITAAAYMALGYLLLAPRQPASNPVLVATLPHAIAAVNTLTIFVLLGGYAAVKRKKVKSHKYLMLTAFGLITAFLIMYLARLYLGGVKQFTGPAFLRDFVYLPALTVHLGLSILSIPLVLYNILTGGFLPVAEVGSTKHRKVGRWAVRLWTLSLALGVLVYFLLNYV
ncbi:MAG: DUF420 domain-containing protein [Candidatus Caldarchaeum sp.]